MILQPRILRLPVGEEDAGKTIKEFLMKKTGFSSKQLSRFKYRKDGILLNGEKRYVTALLQAGDVLEIRLTQGGEPVEEHPYDALQRGAGTNNSGSAGENSPDSADRYLAAKDGRLQKIWAAPAAWLSEKYPLKILYEDEDILAADKPGGVVCHPSPGHYNDTLSNQVAEHLGRIGRELDVRVTGRLDRDTSGIVIFALNTETAAMLIRQRQAQTMQKIYIARVRGHFHSSREKTVWEGINPEYRISDERTPEKKEPGETVREEMTRTGMAPDKMTGTIDRPLRRESPSSFRMVVAEDGKAARTHYRVLAELEDGTSLVVCRIEHGRTHQIRVHMAYAGHPLVGDTLYGTQDGSNEDKRDGTKDEIKDGTEDRTKDVITDGLKNGTEEMEGHAPLMLHAWKAEFVQPFTGETIRISAALPGWASLPQEIPAGTEE